MPPAEEIERYFKGVWRMMLGRPDGLKMLDLSADGFWNSFFAMLVAVPALGVGWVSFANDLASFGDGFGGRVSIVGRLAMIDFVAWVAPLVVLALVVRYVGLSDRFVPFVVSGNWGGALLSWFMLPPSLIRLFVPEAAAVSELLWLLSFFVAMVLSWRLTHAALGRGPALTTAVFAGMFGVSVIVLIVMQSWLGVSQI